MKNLQQKILSLADDPSWTGYNRFDLYPYPIRCVISKLRPRHPFFGRQHLLWSGWADDAMQRLVKRIKGPINIKELNNNTAILDNILFFPEEYLSTQQQRIFMQQVSRFLTSEHAYPLMIITRSPQIISDFTLDQLRILTEHTVAEEPYIYKPPYGVFGNPLYATDFVNNNSAEAAWGLSSDYILNIMDKAKTLACSSPNGEQRLKEILEALELEVGPGMNLFRIRQYMEDLENMNGEKTQ